MIYIYIRTIISRIDDLDLGSCLFANYFLCSIVEDLFFWEVNLQQNLKLFHFEMCHTYVKFSYLTITDLYTCMVCIQARCSSFTFTLTWIDNFAKLALYSYLSNFCEVASMGRQLWQIFLLKREFPWNVLPLVRTGSFIF